MKHSSLREGMVLSEAVCVCLSMQIKNAEQFWKWSREVLVPNLKAGPWYNGGQPFGLRGFLEDRVNRIMGFASLRQVRARPSKYFFVLEGYYLPSLP